MRQTKKVPTGGFRVATIEIQCDLCGVAASDPDAPDNPWKEQKYMETETTIQMATRLPLGQVETISFDICPSCFRQKLAQFFAEEGGSLPSIFCC